jgi:ATP-dependent Lhr-like helicase
MKTPFPQQISFQQCIHPALLKYISEKGWKDFTPIQKTAFPTVLEGVDCIIEAPTAGGKTEAVLFPLLTRLSSQKKPSVQVLYLAPLRALLNDIELRVDTYANVCGLHCFKWHGDVGHKSKIDEFRNPSQLLLTTPESLEAIMLRKAGWHTFFSDLDVIIIDEAHNFASGDRGSHLISLLARLEKSINRCPQRIAVSATIGNPDLMLQWLAGTNRKVGKRISVSSTFAKERECKLFYFDENKDQEDQPGTSAIYSQSEDIYKLLPFKKTIVFSNSRTKAEELATAINQINTTSGTKNAKKVRTHHSAVSKYYREEAESMMKFRGAIESGLNAIISTSTLELGIDIGELDQVIQVGALSSSSAFLQRVGRTGRRKDKPQIFIGFCSSENDLILLAAVVSLGQKGISEAINFPTKSFHILAHQLICLSLQNHGISPDTAWDIFSNVHCFSGILRDQFDQLIEFMLENKYFRNVDGLLAVGEECEKRFLGSTWRRLFAVFDSGPTYDVWDNKKHVGTLDSAFVEALNVPFLFVLGGIEWEAYKVQAESREVYVKKSIKGTAPKWVTFSGIDIPCETAKEAGRILFSTESFDFLNPLSQKAIASLRNKFKAINWSDNKWIVMANGLNMAVIWTFAGDRINRTLAKLLTYSEIGTATSDYQSISIIKGKNDQTRLSDSILKLLNRINEPDKKSIHELKQILSHHAPLSVFSKFVKCLPAGLWHDALSEKIFDLEGLRTELNSIKIDVI